MQTAEPAEVSPPPAPTGTSAAGMQTPAQLPVTGGAQDTSSRVPLNLAIAAGMTLVVAAGFCYGSARRTR